MVTPRHRRRLLWLATAAAVVTAAGLLPSVQARGKALAVLAEATGFSFPRPFAPAVSRQLATLDGVTGHLYVPGRRSPPILLLPGAAKLGKDDPRAVRLARALSRAGRTVFVPDLTLYERRFDEEDLDRIVRAVLGLSRHPAAVGPVVMLGVSYGGSFALVAAADQRLGGRLVLVATFGAYFDLIGVIQAVTTGTSLVRGVRIPWEGHPLARSILEEGTVGLAPEPDRAALGEALATGDVTSLSPEGRAIFDFLRNQEPALTQELASKLPSDTRELLERFSPSTVADGVEAPVIAMHSTDDPAVPYGELLRLHVGLPDARIVTVSSFRHVDPTGSASGGWGSLVADAWDAWGFTSWILAAQE